MNFISQEDATPSTNKQHLVGAYGLFWDRAAVDWQPGNGKTWQLLGRIGQQPLKLQVCDFRAARGFYILYNEYGPVYTGIARGKHGLGARLVKHTINHLQDSWTRFCWFSFDDVATTSTASWSKVELDDNLRRVGTDTVVRELEALMIKSFGLSRQNQMNFLQGQKWEKVTWEDCYPTGILRRVDHLVHTPSLRDALSQFAIDA